MAEVRNRRSIAIGSRRVGRRASIDGAMHIPDERNDLLLLDDVLEELLCAPERHSLNGTGGFPSVFEVNAKIAPPRFGGC